MGREEWRVEPSLEGCGAPAGSGGVCHWCAPLMDRSLRGGQAVSSGGLRDRWGQTWAAQQLLWQQQQKGADGASRAAAGAPLHVPGG